MQLLNITDERIRNALMNSSDIKLRDEASLSISRSSIMDVVEQSGVVFRLNTGSVIDLSGLQPVKSKDISYGGMMETESNYFADPLPPGVHAILGQPGSGKSGFSRLLMEAKKIPLYTLFERTISNDSKTHDPELLKPGSALNVTEITRSLREALTYSGAILDSIRFIGLLATGFPAIMQGTNSGLFAFCQWLNIVAERLNVVLFVVVSTERKDSQMNQLYEDYLTGACNSVLTMHNHGTCGLTRADKARVGKVMTTFINDFDWIAGASEDEEKQSFQPKFNIEGLK